MMYVLNMSSDITNYAQWRMACQKYSKICACIVLSVAGGRYTGGMLPEFMSTIAAWNAEA